MNYYICEDNEQITDALEIASSMNNYFINIGKVVSEKIEQPLNSTLILLPYNNYTMHLFPTAQEEVSNGINVKTIKYLTEFLVNPLVHIMNISIEKVTWPDS